jgi:hypothetical protein
MTDILMDQQLRIKALEAKLTELESKYEQK